jgi:hypothetical protein
MTFVDSNEKASVFHHPVWINLLADSYGYRPFVIAVMNQKGEIIAGLPIMEINSFLTGRRWVSLPFSDHCKFLQHDVSSSKILFTYLEQMYQEQNIPRVEIRSDIPMNGKVQKDKNQVLHVLNLSENPKETYENFSNQIKKKNISRAERDGVEVRWAKEKKDLDLFYNLHLNTRKRLGVPIQPKRYFELLWERIIRQKFGFLLLAYINNVPIAGAVFLTYKNSIIYKYSASDREYRKYRANHLLLWNAIRWGCENGKRHFDFGKTSVSNTGLCDFKRSWGAIEQPLVYSTFSKKPNRETNIQINNIMENIISKSPSWLCRITGELLYSHYG